MWRILVSIEFQTQKLVQEKIKNRKSEKYEDQPQGLVRGNFFFVAVNTYTTCSFFTKVL